MCAVRCVYIQNAHRVSHGRFDGTHGRLTHSPPGYTTMASLLHLAKTVLTPNCVNVWSGSGARAGQAMRSVPIFLAEETLLPSCVGIAPHLEERGAPFASSSPHRSHCFCPLCYSACMEFDRRGFAHCHTVDFLRTMEALTLQRFQITAHNSCVLLTLPATKTGKRTRTSCCRGLLIRFAPFLHPCSELCNSIRSTSLRTV